MASALYWTEEEAATRPRGPRVTVDDPPIALPVPSLPPKRRRSAPPPPPTRSRPPAPARCSARVAAMSWSGEPSYHPVTPLPAPLPVPHRLADPDLPPEPPPPPPVENTPAVVVRPSAHQPVADVPRPEPAYEPAYGEPAYGEPAYGEPAYGEPAYGEPAYGEPAYGEPAYGEPAYGEPAYGEPAYGEPAYGEPAYGDEEEPDHGEAMHERMHEPITVPAPPPVPQLARERDVPSDDGLWKGDDLLVGRDPAERPAPSTFGDHHLGDAPSWPSARPRTSLVPTALPSRHGGTGWPETSRWLAAALLAAIAALVTWHWLTPGSGSLEIRLADSDRHPEVDVQVDGVSRCGTTPCILDDLTAGSHVVEVGSRDGRVLRRRVDVRSDEHSLLSLAFPPTRRPAPIGQGVELRSELSPVKVSVDGEPRGTLPILIDDLSTGEHVLRLSSPGRRPIDKKVKVAAGEVVRLHGITLPPGKGTVRIELFSPGARVLVGRRGKQAGRRALYGPWPRDVELDTARDWEIVAGGPGYRSKVFPIAFDDEGRARVKVRLDTAAGMRDLYE